MTKLRFAAVALVATVSTTSLFAQQRPDRRQTQRTPDAKTSIEPEGVAMAATREHPGARMDITGPYEWRRTEILKPGQIARISVEGMREARPPDGLYSYTITPVVRTDQKLRSELHEARETGDNGRVVELNQKLERAAPQYGTFRILNGRFVDPPVEESGIDRDQGSNLGPDGARTDLGHKIYVAESAYRGPRNLASTSSSGMPPTRVNFHSGSDPGSNQFYRHPS